MFSKIIKAIYTIKFETKLAIQSEFDITVPRFPAPLRRFLVSNNLFSYKAKCIIIGPIFYLLGALVSFFTGTFTEYFLHYPTFMAFLTSSLTLCGIVYACKQVSVTIYDLNPTIEHSKDDKFQVFISNINNERTWHKLRMRYWYYIHIIGFAIAFAGAAYFGLYGPPIWVVYADQSIRWIINLYFYAVAAPAIGYIVGNCFNLAMEFLYDVNYYSTTFIKADKLKLFPPEEIAGLKPIGTLAWKFNAAVVIPVFFALSIILDNLIREGITLLDKAVYPLALSLYVVFLSFVFLYPIWPVHNALAEAKKKAIEQSNLLIRQKSDIKLLENPTNYQSLDNLLLVNKKIRKFKTWPLDLPSSLRSVVTILSPLISGGVLNWVKGFFNLG
jgi:hypothetical protein